MSIKYFYPDNHPTVFLESEEDLAEIVDVLHTQAIDNLGEDSPVTHRLECWLDDVNGMTSNWYDAFIDVEEQKNRFKAKATLYLWGLIIHTILWVTIAFFKWVI